MPRHAYALYVSTFDDAAEALRVGDEARLRALCARVADRGGIESTVSLMAMSDAENGVGRRARAHVAALFWCEAAHGGGPGPAAARRQAA